MRLLGAIVLEAARIREMMVDRWLGDPAEIQRKTLLKLVRLAEDTQWGRRFEFEGIHSVEDFQRKVPLGRYEDFEPYWSQAVKGVWDVTWPGKITYFALTSGTTETTVNKAIPISREMWKNNQRAAFDTMVFYLLNTRDTHVFEGKVLFLGGSTELRHTEAGTYMGDLSGIQTVHVPWYLRRVYSPGQDVARMSNWEEKIVQIARTTCRQDVRVISGIPSWLGILFDYVRDIRKVKNVRDVWPNLSLLIHGGVDFSPYRRKFQEMLGEECSFLEVYPASEGFIGMQNDLSVHDLLLMADYDIFYEFVPVDELDSENPTRLTVADVDADTNYAIVLTTNAGLWAYVLGDTVRFTSLRPHKLKVTGRTKHFLSAFGEHLIVQDVDTALSHACEVMGEEIVDYTVAPLYPEGKRKLPAHQWLIEFRRPPRALERFAVEADKKLREVNEDYAAHRSGGAGMLLPEFVAVAKGTFYEVMKRKGKLGGQNKVPRLQNKRDWAESALAVCEDLGGAVAEVPAGSAGT